MTIYLILTNPTFDYVAEWECGVTQTNPYLYLLEYYLYGGGWTIGHYSNLYVHVRYPLPTSTTTLLASFELLYLNDHEPTGLFIHGIGNEEYPLLLSMDGEIFRAGMSVDEGPAIQINGDCMVVFTDNMSFDSVKCLYR